jgi:Mrp family chromosome partitioning ATPase
MEKIQLALERARREREASLPVGAAPRRANGSATAAITLKPPQPAALTRHRIVVEGGGNAVTAEAFRMLRVQVLQRLAAIGGTSLAVTSPRSGDGKTLVAVNLAFALARHVEKGVILVDGDLRRPSVHRHLGITPEHDIIDHLEGRAELDACLVRPTAESFLALLGSKTSSRSSELLSLTRTRELFAELKARFPNHVVIVDCPPLLSTEEPQIIQGLVDGCLLVVREGSTSKADLRRAADLVGESRYLGSVLNDSRWESLSTYRY